jgi:hypothetical protein
MRSILIPALLLAAGSAHAAPGDTLELTDRQIEVNGVLNLGNARKVATRIIQLDTEVEAPIYLLNSCNEGGTAQAVMMLADTIRSLRSPVVNVVVTEVYGAGAAFALFGDRVVIFPSAGLVFTEVEYEGVHLPDPPKEGEQPKELKPPEKMLQAARTKYLERFWDQVAGRLGMKTPALTAKIAEGGLAMTPAEAVQQKAAYAVIGNITYTRLGEMKKELKVTTTEKKARQLPIAPEGSAPAIAPGGSAPPSPRR